MATSKCAKCSEVFTGVKAFDAHQVADYVYRRITCTEPASVGLIQDGKGRWGYTDGEAVKAKMAKARAARGIKGQSPSQVIYDEISQQPTLPKELLDGLDVTRSV